MKTPKQQQIILFDGECTLCNGFINFVIDKDLSNKFLFATLQSESRKEIQKKIGVDPQRLDSIVLFDPQSDRYSRKSDAALKIIGSFGGMWPLCSLFFLIPRLFRNWVYDWIAANRYLWFGKNSCRIPTPELQRKFLV